MDNKEKIYIFGHHNPDTDSVCGAISLSYLKNKLGFNTEPRVLDGISKETSFVLDFFGVSKPKHLDDVKLQIKDIEYHKNCFMKDTDSIKKTYDFLSENKITGVPVVDDDGNFLALITLKMLLKEFIGGELTSLKTSYDNLVDVLCGKEVLRYSDFISGDVLVGGYKSVVFVQEVNLSSKNILITSNRPIIIKHAIDQGVKTIILVGDQELDLDILNLAKENEVNVISTSYDTFHTAKLISLANYISTVFEHGRAVCFNENEYYDDFIIASKKLKHNNYPVIDKNNKCLGLLRLTDVSNVNRKKVILVDHNEEEQSVLGLNEADIVEIVDHHKLGDITTSSPINFRNMAVGSSNTIIYSLYKENGVDIPRDMAGIMLSGILSDTLILSSPTTTDVDREVVEELSEIAGIDYKEYGLEMFKAGTSIKGMSKEEILNTDVKTFSYDDKKYTVAQVFTMDVDEILKDMDEYIRLIEEMRVDIGSSFVVVAITDIIKNGSYFIYTKRAKDILDQGYLIDSHEGMYLDGQISRKKQIVPAIISGFNRLQ